MVPNMLNAKRCRLEYHYQHPVESSSSSTPHHNKTEVQSLITPERMSGVSGNKNKERAQLFGNTNGDLVRINQDHKMHKVEMDRLVSGLAALESSIQVEAIHIFCKRSFTLFF
ncbi:hypothetical protein A4A49_12424 [Nicotiana attenuata]|uniref:Uncharacterized protein n=1 Tax=Nicotiana attenuata TaxID=49451 RepID=A0A1J6IQF8_NICAT|nr:hypothetical protein A4A49_12424 [Nicotiana attenuata]